MPEPLTPVITTSLFFGISKFIFFQLCSLAPLIIILSLLIAIILAIGGRILFSLPLFFLALSALKIKGLTAFQIWQIWRLLNYLRSTGRYSHFGQNNQTRPSSNLSADEAYKILGIKKGTYNLQRFFYDNFFISFDYRFYL